MPIKDSLSAWVIIALAVCVPWMTWWLLTTNNPNMAVTETPIYLAGIGFILVLAAWIAKTDVWLGSLVGYVAIRVFPSPSPYSFEACYLFGLGASAFVILKTVPVSLIAKLKYALLIGGAAQVGYGVLQYVGYDPIWLPWGQPLDPTLDVRGTLGNRNFFGAYTAICLVLSPVWLMPVFLVGLVISKSIMPILACAVGLAFRFRHSKHGWAVIGILLGAGVMWAAVRPHSLSTAQFRLDVWWYALKDWTAHPLVGWGTGQWPLRIPQAQMTQEVSKVANHLFVQAHNDWLQLLYEEGMIGFALLCGWLWSHRMVLQTASAGAVVVIAVNAFGNFPFHVGTTALLALVVIGLACAEEAALPVKEIAHDSVTVPHALGRYFRALAQR